MKNPSNICFIYGYGYSAKHLTPLLLKAGWEIWGTTRSSDKANLLDDAGVRPILLDADGKLETTQPLPRSHLIISAPPAGGTCPALTALSPYAGRFSSVTYLSTTGVYGDHSGGWVDEASALTPVSDRGRARVITETSWKTLCARLQTPFRTVRLPGIYGPGRSALDRVKAGTARRLIKPGQVFSRIHVDDLATGLVKLLQRPSTSGVFHLCDDLPAPPQDVIAYAANLLSLPIPPDLPYEPENLSPMARSFYAECKRVSNLRTKLDLDWWPAYPTYRIGLRSILELSK